MSGRTKRILYHVADAALFAALGLGMLLVSILVPFGAALDDREIAGICLAAGVAATGGPVLLHECGHLLFGTVFGMKLARFGFHPYTLGPVAGETAMFPKNGRHIKGKFIALTLGGAAVNLLLGALLLCLWLFLPVHPAGCGALSGFMLHEGIRSLLPAELPAGKTDGAVFLGLVRKDPEEEIAVRVLTAQGILYRGTFDEIGEEFFSVPVVREDLPARLALLFLEMQWRLSRGEEDEAKRCLDTLMSLSDYLTGEEMGELTRYEGYFEGNFQPTTGKFYGVNALEEQLKRA